MAELELAQERPSPTVVANVSLFSWFATASDYLPWPTVARCRYDFLPIMVVVVFQVEELFNIVNAVKKVVIYTQTTSESTAAGVLQRLVSLATTTLECNTSLKVVHVQGVGQEKEDVPEPSVRSQTSLTKVAISTREALADGFARRFVAPRYGRGLETHSHRYDMAMFLTPRGRGLRYIETLKNSTVGRLGFFSKSAEEVKKVILKKVRGLLIEGINTFRARPNTTPLAVEDTAPCAKRLKTDVGAAADPVEAEFIEQGIMDPISDEEMDSVGKPVTISPEDEADTLIEEWEKAKVCLCRHQPISCSWYFHIPGLLVKVIRLLVVFTTKSETAAMCFVW